MFSKKPPPQSFKREPRTSLAARALGLVRRRPALVVGGAAGVFVTAAATALVAAADPHAGLPSVQIALSAPGAPAPPPGWREALAPDPSGGQAPVTNGSLQLFVGQPPDDGAQAPVAGQAIISFPDGTPPGAPAIDAHSPLIAAPISGLTAPGPGGAFLPIIGADGRSPSQAYARPFTANGKPKVALVIGGLGLNAKETRQAIEQLPPEITLSFVPYADGLQGWIDLARANGHEVLLEAPMEPKDYPDNDPGPMTLLTSATPADLTGKVDYLLSRATGYFGLTNYLGSKFVASAGAMGVFEADLQKRGLAFIDDGSAAASGGGVPRASADKVIDDQLEGAAIDQALAALETDAQHNGQALGSGFAYPITLDEVARWAQTVASRGLQLAPASAVMARR
ncbi:MAG TPA: divergent polysaccharide deacetylase family protein [Caulobacteraceae bacterium]|nr:divergent polysaccharide deacetylase family protein [Caulobacteraceae bacterium]